MPKLKTNKSATKRFKRTGTGNFKHRSSFRSHIMTKKRSKRKARLAPMRTISKRDKKLVQRMMGEI
jgi:large subunit ribosomal protein L35